MWRSGVGSEQEWTRVFPEKVSPKKNNNFYLMELTWGKNPTWSDDVTSNMRSNQHQTASNVILFREVVSAVALPPGGHDVHCAELPLLDTMFTDVGADRSALYMFLFCFLQ